MLRTNFVEPCLSDADKPPSDPGRLHEIKHDGYRLMARRGARRAASPTATDAAVCADADLQ